MTVEGKPPGIAKRLLSNRLFWVAVVVLAMAGGGGAYVGRVVPAGPAEGMVFNGPAVAGPVGHTLKLGTFNIDGGEGVDDHLVKLDRTAKSLQKLDFIGLQEVHGFGDDPPDNQAITLGGLLKMPYIYAPAERRWGHDAFGNAVFTDLKVDHWQRVVLPSKGFHALRNYVRVDAQWQGKPIHLLVTHVDWKEGGDEQLAIVIKEFLSLPTPAVLLGDLNHAPDKPQILALRATPGVHEAVSEVLEKTPAEKIGGRVDWIFLRGLVPVDAGKVDLKASDHPAYWAAVRREETVPGKISASE
jgi:endonuclease/exonuclease/phosphatase family metal-dependent hydrolase